MKEYDHKCEWCGKEWTDHFPPEYMKCECSYGSVLMSIDETHAVYIIGDDDVQYVRIKDGPILFAVGERYRNLLEMWRWGMKE